MPFSEEKSLLLIFSKAAYNRSPSIKENTQWCKDVGNLVLVNCADLKSINKQTQLVVIAEEVTFPWGGPLGMI